MSGLPGGAPDKRAEATFGATAAGHLPLVIPQLRPPGGVYPAQDDTPLLNDEVARGRHARGHAVLDDMTRIPTRPHSRVVLTT